MFFFGLLAHMVFPVARVNKLNPPSPFVGSLTPSFFFFVYSNTIVRSVCYAYIYCILQTNKSRIKINLTLNNYICCEQTHVKKQIHEINWTEQRIALCLARSLHSVLLVLTFSHGKLRNRPHLSKVNTSDTVYKVPLDKWLRKT